MQQVITAAGSQPEALTNYSPAVSTLCVKLRDMLSHGLKPFVSRAPGSAWSSYLPPKQTSAWAMLQVCLGLALGLAQQAAASYCVLAVTAAAAAAAAAAGAAADVAAPAVVAVVAAAVNCKEVGSCVHHVGATRLLLVSWRFAVLQCR